VFFSFFLPGGGITSSSFVQSTKKKNFFFYYYFFFFRSSGFIHSGEKKERRKSFVLALPFLRTFENVFFFLLLFGWDESFYLKGSGSSSSSIVRIPPVGVFWLESWKRLVIGSGHVLLSRPSALATRWSDQI
jgi:hypothetical protein